MAYSRSNESTVLWKSLEEIYYKYPRTYYSWTRTVWGDILDFLADHIDARGNKKIDLDPGEVSDWLRAEADAARSK